jgi:hypothetical protein
MATSLSFLILGCQPAENTSGGPNAVVPAGLQGELEGAVITDLDGAKAAAGAVATALMKSLDDSISAATPAVNNAAQAATNAIGNALQTVPRQAGDAARKAAASTAVDALNNTTTDNAALVADMLARNAAADAAKVPVGQIVIINGHPIRRDIALYSAEILLTSVKKAGDAAEQALRKQAYDQIKGQMTQMAKDLGIPD